MLNLAQPVGAGVLPALVSAPTKIAGPRGNSLWVKAGILIQGDDVRGVGGTEDVTAMAAVVTTQKETKGRTASGRVTARRGRVRLHHVSYAVLREGYAGWSAKNGEHAIPENRRAEWRAPFRPETTYKGSVGDR